MRTGPANLECDPRMNHSISPEQLLGQLHWRYPTKQFDSARRIEPQLWSALENALVLSPSTGGFQPWTFVVVDDLAKREKRVPASFGQSQVKDASHLVAFAAKQNFSEVEIDAHIQRTADLCGVTVESLAPFRDMLVDGIVKAMDQTALRAWAGRQIAIALGNLLTNAAMLGIDARPMDGFVPGQDDSILGLEKKGLRAFVICTLGYRSVSDAYAALPKVRFPKADVLVHI
jgi:nitroreductase